MSHLVNNFSCLFTHETTESKLLKHPQHSSVQYSAPPAKYPFPFTSPVLYPASPGPTMLATSEAAAL